MTQTLTLHFPPSASECHAAPPMTGWRMGHTEAGKGYEQHHSLPRASPNSELYPLQLLVLSCTVPAHLSYIPSGTALNKGHTSSNTQPGRAAGDSANGTAETTQAGLAYGAPWLRIDRPEGMLCMPNTCNCCQALAALGTAAGRALRACQCQAQEEAGADGTYGAYIWLVAPVEGGVEVLQFGVERCLFIDVCTV